MRRGHEDLIEPFQTGEERTGSLGVELGEHIVEQQHRRFARHVAQYGIFTELECKDRGSLLTLRAETRECFAVEQELNLIAVRAHKTSSSRKLGRTLLA